MTSKVICGKWEDELPKQPDESVNLVLTDPPYGLGYVSNIPGSKQWNSTGKTESRFEKPLAGDDPAENDAMAWHAFFEHCHRVLKPDSYCVLHCTVPFVGQKWDAIEKSGLKYKGTVAWNKRFAIGGDLKGAMKRNWEPIVYLAKGKPSMNTLEVVRKGNVVERERISEIDDWVFMLKKPERCGHPTQKPLSLTKRFILGMTQEGNTVLDPFAGSGTVLVAAESLQRNSIGIELEQKFCEMVEKRLQTLKA